MPVDTGFESPQYVETDIQLVAGDAPSRVFIFRKGNPDGSYSPLLLTGKTVKLIAKQNLTDADGSALYTYTSPSGGIVIDADGSAVGAKFSQVTVRWTAAHLAAAGRHHYRVQLTQGASVLETVMAGEVVVEAR